MATMPTLEKAVLFVTMATMPTLEEAVLFVVVDFMMVYAM
jgi:hypothetical protein